MIYVVKDDTKIKLHLVLYIKVNSLGTGVSLSEVYTTVKQRPRTLI